MAPVIPDPQRIVAFADRRGFEEWLADNHDAAPEIWVRMFKKGTGVLTISPAEAVEAALCWGWIDAIRKTGDATSFLQRFCPRRRQSPWSQVNREIVAKLIAEDRMRPPGLAQVETAKADGRWERAYAPPSRSDIPDDLKTAIAAVPAAQATFETLNAANRYALAYRLGTLKTAEARARRVGLYVGMLARGETIHPNGNGARKCPAEEDETQ